MSHYIPAYRPKGKRQSQRDFLVQEIRRLCGVRYVRDNIAESRAARWARQEALDRALAFMRDGIPGAAYTP